MVAYVTPDYLGRLAVFSPEGERRRVLNVGRFATGVDVSSDGAFALVGSGDVFDLASGARVASLAIPPNGIADVGFEPESVRALVTHGGERHVQSVSGFDPSLSVAGTPSVGKELTFSLDLPGEAGRPFQIAASESSIAGIPLGDGRRFPLDSDRIFRLTRAADGPFAECVGTLDRHGRATVTITLPEGLPIRGAGFPLSFAFATFESPSRLHAETRLASNVLTVTLLP